MKYCTLATPVLNVRRASKHVLGQSLGMSHMGHMLRLGQSEAHYVLALATNVDGYNTIHTA